MPRRRPGQIRAGALGGHRSVGTDTRPVIDGLSSRAQSEITRLERTRTHLRPGDVADAAGLWKNYVRRSVRQLWRDDEQGDAHEYCCGSPLEARSLLDSVMRALSPRSARELRTLVSRSDAMWKVPIPPRDPDGRR